MILGKFFESRGDLIWLIARIVFGGMFALHGLSKFGIPTGTPATDMLFIVGGAIEIAVGIAVLAGFLTRLAGLAGVLQMAVALAMFHLPRGFDPLNNGELAFLFLAFFLVVLAYGSGKYGLEKMALKKELL